MDKRIIINGFGPIKHAEVDLSKSLQVLIGAQASGKSTICKVVYFCLKIRDYSMQFVSNASLLQASHRNEGMSNYFKYLTKQFMECFGTTKHMKSFSIVYRFQGETIKITLNEGFVKYTFSESLRKSINEIIKESIDFYDSQTQSYTSFQDIVTRNILFRQQISIRINQLFDDSRELIFVPAGRSVLASMSEQLQGFSLPLMDLIMQEFITRIQETRNRFGTKIPDMVKGYLKTVKGQINNNAVNEAYELIHKVLKADYVSENDGEKIYYDETHWVKLLFASSGQQEALWVLMPCFLQILQNEPCFMVIEEPEAHLFPDAQRDIVELVALLVQATGSTVIMTTHSPYVLTSINLLLLSGNVEKNNYKADPIVPITRRLNASSFSANSVLNGKMSNIFDSETMLVDPEYIDRISGIINTEFDKLIERANS